jgi:steroid delta-isomerase-like uncharacterized protein
MASKNVEALRNSFECWNRRDFEGSVRDLSDNCTYTDHARGETIRGKQNIKDYFQSWAMSFSDGKTVNVNFLEAGDTVVCRFTADGTNDGPMGNLPPTNRRASFAFCEIFNFDKNGKITSGECYYDMYGVLAQLGHLKPMTKAA